MTTLRQKIGQMLIMGFDEAEITDTSPVKQWLAGDGLGGVILYNYDFTKKSFGKNIVDREQLIRLIKDINTASAISGDLPLFIAVDYEGGEVDRLTGLAERVPTITARQAADMPIAEVEKYFNQMALNLKELGFNLNFAPVVDLALSEAGIINRKQRSFGAEADKVTTLAECFVNQFAAHGIVCCYKHFPGHGSANGDTHFEFVDVSETFITDELKPYQALANDSTTMIMTAHVINRQLDDSGLPATLSYKTLTELLRHKLGFKGVIISDDLQMHAISKYCSFEDTLKLTINAGADMLIIANQLANHSANDVIDIIEKLVNTNQITVARIEEAFNRIVSLKHSLSVTPQQLVERKTCCV